MTGRRNDGIDHGALPVSRQPEGGESISPFPLGKYVRNTERIIGDLRRELKEYRAANESLMRDRSAQILMLTRLELTGRNAGGLEAEVRFLRCERDRLARQGEVLREERDAALDRSGRMESALAQLTTRHQEALEVIAYLEAQIDDIESIVRLLREHRSFMGD